MCVHTQIQLPDGRGVVPAALNPQGIGTFLGTGKDHRSGGDASMLDRTRAGTEGSNTGAGKDHLHGSDAGKVNDIPAPMVRV